MSMPEIRKKRKAYGGLRGSLTTRIITVAFCFLVIPFVVLSIIFYFYEMSTKQRDNFYILNMIGESTREIQGRYLRFDRAILTSINFDFKGDLAGVDQKEYNALFAQIAQQIKVDSVFFAEKRSDGQFVIALASEDGMIGKNFTKVLQARRSDREVYSFFFHPFYDKLEPSLFIVKNTYDSSGVLTGALCISVAYPRFQRHLRRQTHLPYPVTISITDAKGVIQASSIAEFIGRRIVKEEEGATRDNTIVLQPLSDDRSRYYFSLGGERYMGVYTALPEEERWVLLSMPARVNLVDVGTYIFTLFILFIVIFVGGIIGYLWITLRMAKPLRQLCRVLMRASCGERDVRFQRDPLGFEMNIVGEMLNDTFDAFEAHIREVKKQKAEKESLSKELMIGQKIQTSLLPTKIPEIPGVEVAAGFISAHEVGGDFYDIVAPVSDDTNTLFLTMADASGKGVFACLYSLMLRSMLRSFFNERDPLETILMQANNLFHIDAEETSAFVTLWSAIYNVKTCELTYANCGHFPALVVSSTGYIEALDTKNMALGVLPFSSVSTAKYQLQSGNTLVLFTDGIIEAHNDEGAIFGMQRLRDLLAAHADLAPQELVDMLLHEVRIFAEGCPQHDDMSVLAFRLQ